MTTTRYETIPQTEHYLMFNEKDLIDFAYYSASFSKQPLLLLDDVLSATVITGKKVIKKEYTLNNTVFLKDIVGTCDVQHAGKRWLDLIIEEGYLKEDVEPVFNSINVNILSQNTDSLGKDIVLIKVNHRYFIRDGHKRIALARHFHEMQALPAKITSVTVMHYEFA